MKTKYYFFKTEKQRTRIGIFIFEDYFSYFYNNEIGFQEQGNRRDYTIEQAEDMTLNDSKFIRDLGYFLKSHSTARYRYYVTKKDLIVGTLLDTYIREWTRELKSS